MSSTSDKFREHLAKLKEKKRKRDSIVDHVTELQSANICDVDPTYIESILCLKHGAHVIHQLRTMLSGLPSIIKAADKKVLLETGFQRLGLGYSPDEQMLIDRAFSADNNYSSPQAEELLVLSPPVNTCVKCNHKLICHNKPSEVTVYKLDGICKAWNICWKCERCDVNYNYCRFGNKKEGYQFYSKERKYVQATNGSFLDRKLVLYQVFLANHAWVSFVGFTESYNEAIKANNVRLERKIVADAFYWHEIEEEIRSRKMVWIFKGHLEDMKDIFMEEIEERRRKEVYRHTADDCSPLCKKKGCENFVAMDGIWKLRHPHCMYPVKSVIKDLPLVNYPDVCTNEPEDQTSAFCKVHCQLAKKHSIPTNLRQFVHEYCKVEKRQNVTDDAVTINIADAKQINDAVSKLPESDQIDSNVAKSQGTSEFLSSHPKILEECQEEDAMGEAKDQCNKDTGETQKVLRKWSRGLFHHIRGGGHIDKWNPLYMSEGPGQVFLLTIHYLMQRLEGVPEEKWEDFFLAYDNMCNLDRLKAAKKPLALPKPYDEVWLKINKVIDRLHMRNHKRRDCKIKYSSDSLKEKLPELNTPVAEQTFIWAARFKKIMCAMPKRRQLFFYHRMVVRRNAYTSKAYKANRQPELPKVHGADK